MDKAKAHRKRGDLLEPSTIRASISFPAQLYGSLEQLAKQKKVSLAWVVRDAADRYVVNEAAAMKARGAVR